MSKFIHLLLRVLFGFEAHNVAALKTPGPVLLLPNHLSWIDWLFMVVWLDSDWRFVTSSETAKLSPYAAKRMAEHLQGGGRLVLFPEGRISTTGSLMKLFDGTGFLLAKSNAK